MPSASRARRRACGGGRNLVMRQHGSSIICVSTRSTGLRVIIGSWKIIAMRSPRRARISPLGQFRPDPVPLIPDRSAFGDTGPAGRPGPLSKSRSPFCPIPRLADEAKHLAAADRERYAVDGFHHTGAGEEMRPANCDSENFDGHAAHRFSRGIAARRATDPPTRLIDEDRDQQRDARIEELAIQYFPDGACTDSRWRSAGRARAR